jgi:hypothetical protein
MHVIYSPEDIDYWLDFYKSSISGNQQYQLGGVLPGFRAYAPYHRGGGIGSIFKSLYRLMLPMLKTVGKQALVTGSRVAADLASGQDLKSTLKSHGRDAASTMLSEAAERIKQQGQGIGRRKRKRRVKTVKRKRTKKSSSFKKRKLPQTVGSDIFSLN